MIAAVRSGRLEAAALLLQNNADPDYIDDRGRTALHYAADTGSVPLTCLLLKVGSESEDEG